MDKIKKQINLKFEGFSIGNLKTSLIFALFSFLMGRLTLSNGISPFAQSFLLGSGNSILVFLSAILGIISNNSINKYKYSFMLIFSSFLLRLIKLVFPDANSDNVAPLVLFFGSLIFGMIFVIFTDYVIYDILLVVFESFISAVFYFVTLKFALALKNEDKKFFSSAEIAAPLCILCVVIAGIGNLPLPWELSLKNIVCVYIILISSLYANTGSLAQISVFMGIAAGAGNDYFAIFLSYYAIDSIACSVFARYGKLAAVLGFVAGNIAISILLAENMYMVVGFQDIAVAALLFILTPEKHIGKLKTYFYSENQPNNNAEAIKSIATVKLDRLSSAFSKLADTINSSASHIKNNSLSSVYDSVADKVCSKCTMRFYCWQKDYDSTTRAFSGITNALKQRGTAVVKDFPDYFRHKCIKTNEILNSIISAYEISRLNAVWQNKMRENAKLYREQFCELSGIVRHLKNEIEENPCFDKTLSDELAGILELEGFQIKTINVLKDYNDSYQVDIVLFPCGETNNKCYEKIASVLEKHLMVPFVKSNGKCSFKECHLIFNEAEIYSLDCAVRQTPKLAEDKCGDCWSINLLENGSKYIALCDGSGSGSEASEYSNSTLRLLEEFLKTGFSRTSSLKLINSSFMNNPEQDYFSTIDLGVIDLKSGNLEIVKKGAAPTYIMHADGDFDVIKINTLPIGVFNGEKGKLKKCVLRKDDIIVMASDGVSDALNREDWICDALSAIKSNDIEYIADTIMKIAGSSDNAPADDKTVIVGKLRLTDENIA